MSVAIDRTCMSFWFPKIEGRLPTPATKLVTTDLPLVNLLDGEPIEGFDDFLADLLAGADEVRHGSDAFFLRTGHGSGKHEWESTCCVCDRHRVGEHVFNLVEWSHLVDIAGLPTRVWAVRQLLPTAALFTCPGFEGLPITREFRVFIRDDEVEAVYPYWPADAVEQGDPDAEAWRELLAAASIPTDDEAEKFGVLAGMASGLVGGGYWSIDFLQDRAGSWWLTDMADGDHSYRPNASAA